MFYRQYFKVTHISVTLANRIYLTHKPLIWFEGIFQIKFASNSPYANYRLEKLECCHRVTSSSVSQIPATTPTLIIVEDAN